MIWEAKAILFLFNCFLNASIELTLWQTLSSCGRHHLPYFIHFIHKVIEAQRGSITCPGLIASKQQSQDLELVRHALASVLLSTVLCYLSEVLLKSTHYIKIIEAHSFIQQYYYSCILILILLRGNINY